MIDKEDFDFMSKFDGADAETRRNLITQNPLQLPKTFLNLLNQISKDATIQYLLTLLDDVLQEDKSRYVCGFEEYRKKILQLKTHTFIWIRNFIDKKVGNRKN